MTIKTAGDSSSTVPSTASFSLLSGSMPPSPGEVGESFNSEGVVIQVGEPLQPSLERTKGESLSNNNGVKNDDIPTISVDDAMRTTTNGNNDRCNNDCNNDIDHNDKNHYGENSNSNNNNTNKDGHQTTTTKWSYRSMQRGAGVIVNNARFQMTIVGLILINSIMMGIATFNFVSDNPDAVNAFEIVDKIFLIIFTIELGLQFVHHNVKLFLDAWLVFDFIIVVMSWSLESLQVVRTFRVFRALRLVTRVKVLKNLVSALFSVGPRIFAILCLLVLVFYIYAVMCTMLFKNLYQDGFTEFDYFSRLDRSLWTLLVMMTLEWGDVSRVVMDVYPWSWPIFVSFVMITSFIAYNLIVAVVCDSVSIIEKQSKEEMIADESEGGLTTEELQCQQIRRLQVRVAELSKQQQQVLQALLDAGVDSGEAPELGAPYFRTKDIR